MKIGIAIDPWKRPVFQRRLEEAGFQYVYVMEDAEKGIGTLLVETTEDKLPELQAICYEAQGECARLRIKSVDKCH